MDILLLGEMRRGFWRIAQYQKIKEKFVLDIENKGRTLYNTINRWADLFLVSVFKISKILGQAYLLLLNS